MLRSCAPTIGAMCGNDMLDRADALVRECRVPDRYHDDARQEAVLAELEDRDPKRAIERYVRREKTCGLAGDVNDMPKVVRDEHKLTTNDSAETGLLRREEEQRRGEIGARAWNSLPPHKQEVVRLRAMGWTQEEIASHLGVSRRRVRQLLIEIQSLSTKTQS